MSTDEASTGLNILVIDGGGVRGLSSLILLSEIMTRLHGLEDTTQPPIPADYFDVIAGTGTGGLSACMLGRLQMPIKTAIESYTKIAKTAFSEQKLSIGDQATYKGTKLREALKEMIRQVTGNENERMRVENMSDCKARTVVFAMLKRNMTASIPTAFRSYPATTPSSPDCSIWEALYATMAHPDLFKSIEINDHAVCQSFVGGDMGCSNPTAHVLAEVGRLYPNRQVSCILSIGAGHPRVVQILDQTLSQRISGTRVTRALRGMANDSERVAEEMATRFQETPGVYFRFNVDHGMQGVEVGDVKSLAEVSAHTKNYLGKGETNRQMNQTVRAIKNKLATVATLSVSKCYSHLTSLAQLINARHITGGRIKPFPEDLISMVKRCPGPTPAFTGCEDNIAQVGACMVSQGDERRICVVYGLGGAGKTQLALKMIERYRGNWTHILYIDASSKEVVQTTLECYAKDKGIGGTYTDMLVWLEQCRKAWLLVFDNADDPSLDIKLYFPASKHGNILITTRLQALTMYAKGPGSTCCVSSMNQDDALTLLLKLARRQSSKLSESEMQAATLLLQDFGYFALAVVHAGAYIGYSHLSITKYRELYLVHRQSLLERYGNLEIKVDGYSKSIRTAWEMCYKLLAKNDLSRRMLWLIAFLHRDHITEAIFQQAATNIRRESAFPINDLETTARLYVQDYLDEFLDSDGCWDTLLFSEVMSDLASCSLIEFDHVDRAYSVHVLVQEWCRTTMSQPLDLALECATTLVAQSVLWDDSVESHRHNQRLALHVGRVLSQRQGQANVNPGYCFMKVYADSGQWWDKEILIHQVKAASEKALGSEHPETLGVMNALAITYEYQGRWQEAESLQAQVMATCKRVLGKDHCHTLVAMDHLAMMYRNRGLWSKARLLQIQALDGSIRTLGIHHPDTTRTLSTLGAICYSQGQIKEAELLAALVHTANQQLFGKSHPATLAASANLSAVYRTQGRWEEAELLQIQALDACKDLFGESHPYTLISTTNLAATYNIQGRWSEAQLLQKDTLDTSERVLGKDHPDTLAVMLQLAVAYLFQGQWNQAERLQTHILATYNRLLPASGRHPRALPVMNHLASTYHYQGRWSEAELLHKNVLDIGSQVFGEDHSNTMAAMASLAVVYYSQGRTKEAESLTMRALHGCQKGLGEDHPDTLAVKNNLATIYQGLGQWATAELLRTQVLDASKRVLGNKHPGTMTAMSNLASSYYQNGRMDESELLVTKFMKNRELLLDEDHPDRLSSMSNLSSINQKRGRYSEAESARMHLLDACKRLFGNEHPTTLTAMGNLATTYHSQGRWGEAESLRKQHLDASKQVLGDDHPDTISAMSALGSTYQCQGRKEEAELLTMQVLSSRKQVLGEEHPDTLLAMFNLASIHLDFQRWDETEKLLAHLSELQARVVGLRHPDTLHTLTFLVVVRVLRSPVRIPALSLLLIIYATLIWDYRGLLLGFCRYMWRG